jgi:hypothetical protein
MPTFWWNILLPSSALEMEAVQPKHNSATSQDTTIYIHITVKTSNPATFLSFANVNYVMHNEVARNCLMGCQRRLPLTRILMSHIH